MTTLKEMKEYAKAAGITLEIVKVRGLLDITASPPDGKRFSEGGGLSVLVAHQLPGSSTGETLADLLARMKEGVEDL